ncbi:MAG: RNA-binding protein [Gammaproteobacteria bacterium]|nr:MAG: RNA-binding protein [Gammaproteobacteria bacterium]
MNERGIRLDKWLWAARFFRKRSLATEAIQGGHVHVEGQRVKPARRVRVGERIHITRGQEEIEVIVAGLSERRGPASEARQLYEETPESIARRAERAEARRLQAEQPAPRHRPDSRQRRRLRHFLGKD